MTAAHDDMPQVLALADLCGRAGAKALEIGYLHDHVPVEEAAWWASAHYQGAKLMVESHRSPEAAAEALAARLLRGAQCRCGKPVATRPVANKRVCLWRLIGARWTPSCDAPTIEVPGARAGDVDAMQRAFAERHGGRP